MPFYQQQINFMLALAQERSEFLHPFFYFLNYFDTIYFNLVLIALVWIGFSSRWGIRMYLLLMANALINASFKLLVGWPRPCTDMPDLGLLCFSSHGFPSGAAQTSMLFGALLVYYWKNKLAWVIAGTYVLLISFSRLYLFVHYPTDLLGGWVIGLGLFYLFISAVDPIENYIKSKSLIFSCSLVAFVPLLLMFVFPKSIPHYQWDTIAFAVGMFISFKYHLYLKAPTTLNQSLLRGSFASLITIAIYVILINYYPSASKIGVAIWISLLASPLCKSIFQGKPKLKRKLEDRSQNFVNSL